MRNQIIMPKNPGGKSASNGHLPGMNAGGDAFLPPICINKGDIDSGNNASDEEEDVTDGGFDEGVTPQSLEIHPAPRKFRRTKHKHHLNRSANKSSLSDSFVLPLIGVGGSPPSSSLLREPGWRENRAATHPERKGDSRRHGAGGIPISKSCPILGRHRYNAIDYDDDFESDDEDSESDADFKSMSFNVGLSRSKDLPGRNHHDEMTSQLAKLESPRRVDSTDHSLPSLTSSCGSRFPNIFMNKLDNPDVDSGGKDNEHLARKSLLEKYENAKQLSNNNTKNKPLKPAIKRLPLDSPNSRTLDSRGSSFKIGSSSSSDTKSTTSSSSSSTLVQSPRLLLRSQNRESDSTDTIHPSKTRRKNKKHRGKSLDDKNDSKHLESEPPSGVTPDGKCRQWLDNSEEQMSSMPNAPNMSKENKQVVK